MYSILYLIVRESSLLTRTEFLCDIRCRIRKLCEPQIRTNTFHGMSSLKNIRMQGTEGALLRQTDGLTIDNVILLPTKGEAFQLAPTVTNVQIK